MGCASDWRGIPIAACYVEWSVLRVSSAHHWLHSTGHDLSECSHSMVQLVLVLLVTSVLGGLPARFGTELRMRIARVYAHVAGASLSDMEQQNVHEQSRA